MSELNTSFIKTIKDSELAANLVDYGEVLLDSVMKNDTVEKIPILGTIISLGKLGWGVRQIHFAKKLIKFLSACQMSEDEKRGFAKKIQEMNENELGEKLIIAIDRSDDEIKAEYMGRLFKQYAQGKFPLGEFKRAINAIENVYLEDMYIIYLMPGEIQFKPAYITANLYSLGLLDVGIQIIDEHESPIEINGLKYKASRLAVSIIDAIGGKHTPRFIEELGNLFYDRYIKPFDDTTPLRV
jgi:hypothetical protein